MESFPAAFNVQNMGRKRGYAPDDDEMMSMIKNARKQIFEHVVHDREHFLQCSMFYIGFNGKVHRGNSVMNMLAIKQTDFNDQYRTNRVSDESNKRHVYLVQIIAKELFDRFGSNFKTLHCIVEDELYNFFEITEKTPSAICCVEFPQ